ncbi:hypothetical protein GQ600_2699 [Phytophthora cactorum]|nr:hypothetical protein GQ600_2699 [Phytophthora cactorum]
MWPDWSRVRSLGTLHPALESALQKTWHGDKHEAEEARVPVARSCVRVRAQYVRDHPCFYSKASRHSSLQVWEYQVVDSDNM